MLNQLKDAIYIQVATDFLRIRNVLQHKEVELTANPSFSHPRTLLGNFTVADALLRQGLGQVASRSGFRLAAQVVLHPLEKIDGGLTQIEARAFQELILGAGAGQVKIWTGPALSDAQVLQQLGR